MNMRLRMDSLCRPSAGCVNVRTPGLVAARWANAPGQCIRAVQATGESAKEKIMRILSALVILAAAFPAAPAAAADMVAPAVVAAPDVSALDCAAGNALARIKE